MNSILRIALLVIAVATLAWLVIKFGTKALIWIVCTVVFGLIKVKIEEHQECQPFLQM